MTMTPASHRYDVVGSCVLFNTPLDEITRMVAQFGQSGCRTHLMFVDNSPEPIAMPAFDPERVTVLRPGRIWDTGRQQPRSDGVCRMVPLLPHPEQRSGV
jgi:hypothetical protein